jgi:uncharacterized phage protein (TIGR01671 family)
MNKIPNYRVWHKIEKRFVDLRNIDFELESIGYDCQGEANYYDVAKFDEIVFQQFTGVKDKKGNEIYEGDRVRYKLNKNYFYDEVKWEHNGWRVVNEKDDCSFPLITNLEDFEVVGNIFQLPCNPDHNGECLVCDCWLSDCQFLNKENKS